MGNVSGVLFGTHRNARIWGSFFGHRYNRYREGGANAERNEKGSGHQYKLVMSNPDQLF
jgi:hypothetical protein